MLQFYFWSKNFNSVDFGIKLYIIPVLIVKCSINDRKVMVYVGEKKN